MQATYFTNLQLELLKIYSRSVSEEELLDIKRMLAVYFADKLVAETDKLWNKEKLSNANMDEWLKELS